MNSSAQSGEETPHLTKKLGPWTLWGLGVGYVISGEYFGWNLGLPAGGTGGLLAAFFLVTLMYIAFVLSYAELACAIPKAGGGFVYALRGLGHFGGFITGVAQLLEFVFAPPAIAMALGAYVSTKWPEVDVKFVAVCALTLFTALNLWGVKQTALFELAITILAVGELLLFMGITVPHVRIEHLVTNAWPKGWTGLFPALPFAVWFYLAIEGVANAAEEARNPQRDVLVGFGSALATLVVLATGVLICSVGVGGWERVVWAPENLAVVNGQVEVATGAAALDKPLPLALSQVLPTGHFLFQLLISVGGLGLVCSLNGILFAAGRATFEMGRAGYLPDGLSRIHSRTHAPWVALTANWAIGVACILMFDTGELIIISAMAAVLLYILSMESLVRLRIAEPDLPRPYRTPFCPWTPRFAQGLALLILFAMLWENLSGPTPWTSTSIKFLACLVFATGYFFGVIAPKLRAVPTPQLADDAAL